MAQITRDDANALIPVEYSEQIFNGIAQESIALKVLTRLPNMTAKQLRIPVLDTLPFAYWQSSDTAAKKTTKAAWKGVFVTAEELAVIVPISENVLDDSNYPIWEMVMPKIIEALGRRIDEAVLFGTNKPVSFPDGIVTQAIASGNALVKGGSDSFYKVVDDAMFKVEDDGFDVNAIVGGAALNHYFRGLLDANGQPLLAYTDVAALPRYSVKNGAWDRDVAEFVVGDFKQAVYSIRQDVTFKILTEATIKNPETEEEINLAQQDMVALRIVMRLGWQLPNPVTQLNGTASRLPFAAVVKSSQAVCNVSIPASQTFETSIKVAMVSDVADADIYYTTDGNTPTNASTKYTGEVTLSATTTVKAIAIKDGYTSGEVKSATYTKSE